jgi:2-polyprenyl-3-methyl-5-hydroxy-6-metoxy-1,4-benzoquinol methylase
MTNGGDWWAGFFPEFRPVFNQIPAKQSNGLARFVFRKLGLKPGRSFLDCPCGIGRISLPLAKMGIRVTGVDIIPSYVQELEKKAGRRGLKIEVIEEDMRRISFDGRFDAAGNLWTSLGYFENEADNRLTLKRMFRALRPGGKFMLHLINRDWVMANFSDNGWFEVGGIKVLEKRSFDYATSISRDTWHFVGHGKVVARDMMLRIYSLHELLAMLRAVGFVDLEWYGSIKEEPVSRNTRMMYIIGTRPE